MPSPHNFSAEYLQTQMPSIVIMHHSFINFSSYGLENPIYINVVRQPFKRFVSLFNFWQAYGIYNVPRNLTIDECVSTNMTYCGMYCSNTVDYLFEITLDYFVPANINATTICGPQKLQIVKRIVHKYYAAVGYLENYEKFLQVLEILFPKSYPNVTNIFQADGKELVKVNSVQSRPEKTYRHLPNKNTTDILMKRLRYEFDFYHFIRARFDKLHSKLIGKP